MALFGDLSEERPEHFVWQFLDTGVADYSKAGHRIYGVPLAYHQFALLLKSKRPCELYSCNLEMKIFHTHVY
jgi:hypothetical protein